MPDERQAFFQRIDRRHFAEHMLATMQSRNRLFSVHRQGCGHNHYANIGLQKFLVLSIEVGDSELLSGLLNSLLMSSTECSNLGACLSEAI